MAKILALLNIMAMPKGYNGQINAFLHSSEIHCRCNEPTCHFTLISQVTADAFYLTRKTFGLPLYINSFFRCQLHNSKEHGSPTSSHTTGHAIDIRTTEFTKVQKAKLIKIAKANFDVVIEYPHFIHGHKNPQNGVVSE